MIYRHASELIISSTAFAYPLEPFLHMQPGTTVTQSFNVNVSGRDFVAGDVHGHFEMLEALMRKAGFDKAVDRLFITGDLVDRGPFSHQVLEWLDKPWLYTVRGNHEQMIIDSVAGIGDPPRHTRNGGRWFYECELSEQLRIAERLALLPVAIELELASGDWVGIIHSEAPGWECGLTWKQSLALLATTDPEQWRYALAQALYARNRITARDCRPVLGLQELYVGHTTVPEVLHLGNVVYIDTGCSFPDGKLSLIDVLSGEEFFLCA
ncbi:metallophosphoesterase [Pseudomonas sp. zfem001]|uniref:metallophosphoesterase n=1 Tax=Pseudomonas sp. zfem001 TaxID=3078196 RepID=UPI0029293A39|nr:metallophosphoesterase [Pseudomonas sp. zfem001]MDU9407529.1 metallophosphoesterase [Pseudomonas sp. zfem001]